MAIYRCIKTKCSKCRSTGTIQLFLNKSDKATYGTVRHHKDKGTFSYCKIGDVEVLKTLLLNKGFSLSTDKAKSGQTGQDSNTKKYDL